MRSNNNNLGFKTTTMTSKDEQVHYKTRQTKHKKKPKDGEKNKVTMTRDYCDRTKQEQKSG